MATEKPNFHSQATTLDLEDGSRNSEREYDTATKNDGQLRMLGGKGNVKARFTS